MNLPIAPRWTRGPRPTLWLPIEPRVEDAEGRRLNRLPVVPCPLATEEPPHEVRTNGHVLGGHGVYDCRNRSDGRPCGAIIYVAAGIRLGDGGSVLWLAQVRYREMVDLDRQRWSIADVIAYLSITPLPSID